MQLRYNFRLYPDAVQRDALARSFGCARVVFNDGLRARQQAGSEGLPYLSDGDLSKRVITQAKDAPQRAWLGEVSSVVAAGPRGSEHRLPELFRLGHRQTQRSQGRCAEVPVPQDNRQAIRFTKNSRFKVLDNGRLRLPKIGDVEVLVSRRRSTWSDPWIPAAVPIERVCEPGRIAPLRGFSPSPYEAVSSVSKQCRHWGLQRRDIVP